MYGAVDDIGLSSCTTDMSYGTAKFLPVFPALELSLCDRFGRFEFLLKGGVLFFKDFVLLAKPKDFFDEFFFGLLGPQDVDLDQVGCGSHLPYMSATACEKLRGIIRTR